MSRSLHDSPVILANLAIVASFSHKMALRSTGTILLVLIEAISQACVPERLNQRVEKSHPVSAPEAMLE